MGVLDQLKRRIAVPDILPEAQTQQLDPLEREGAMKLQQYRIKKAIGRGASAEVKLALYVPTNTHYALKCISKASLPGFSGAKARGKVLREMTILNHCQHPNIIQVFDTFQDDKCFYLALELATGGLLYDRMINGRIPEVRAAFVIYQLLDAVAYLHDRDIVHRDLKPENIMFKDKSEGSEVMIMDFGVADIVRGNSLLHSPVVGTPRLSAPEVLHLRGHGKPADIWSIGCIAYTILIGFNPFRTAADLKQMKEQADRGPQFPARFWYEISPAAVDLVKRCLTVSPSERITAKQAKMHPWFVQHVPAARDYARATLEAIDEARAAAQQPISAIPTHINVPCLVQDEESMIEQQTPPPESFSSKLTAAPQAC